MHCRAQNYHARMPLKGLGTAENHRKTAKNRAIKDRLNIQNIIFLWLGRVSKTGRILCESGRAEIFTENGRFEAETEGLEFSKEKLKTILVMIYIGRAND